MRKKIGIGISDFGRLRREDYCFIDKSLFIQEIVQAGAAVILLPRPRRFGKTLNLSMLRHFFEQVRENEDLGKRETLFDGLAIRQWDEFDVYFAKYPVIFLTFKDVKERRFADALYKMKDVVSQEYKRHKIITGSLDSTDKDFFEQIISMQAGEVELSIALQRLSKYLASYYKTPPLILLDEYDTPIHAAWQNGYYDEMISFMRGLLSGAFKDNPHIFKGVITGILRVAKESIFSDLNNLDIYTILDIPFSDKFGITKEEMEGIFREYGLEKRIAEADSWYNGYQFGDQTIFNPWSILNFVNNSPPVPKPYWANTSSNALVKELIVDAGLSVRDNIEKLIAGKSIESVIDENIVFPALKNDEKYIYSLLFFSGYLKCLNKLPEKRHLKCELAIPNEEVMYIFENIISGWLTERFENEKLRTMLRALVETRLDQFQRLLNEFVITTLSFFDAKGKNPEAVFQAFILGMLLNLGQEYEISSNRELGYGRYDVLALPRHDKGRPAILMELKSITGFYEEEPDKAISDAVKQVQERGYALELQAKGYENIIKVVVVSDGKKVWVKSI